MAITPKKRLGNRGERAAVRYLKQKGYVILKRNYKCRFGEVDIIAKKSDVVAFVEVKTRTDDTFGQPNEAVREDRMRRYINTAKLFMTRNQGEYVIRFDIIEVTPEGIRHIESAFEA
jgi:putative endonuclease